MISQAADISISIEGLLLILPTFTDKGLARIPFGLPGRDGAECRVDALPIALAFDVGEQVASGRVPSRPSALVDEFDREGVGVLRQAQELWRTEGQRGSPAGCRPGCGREWSRRRCGELKSVLVVQISPLEITPSPV